jgi:arsenate reductase
MKTVLFVCTHNAGRSQMAEAFLNHLAAERNLPVRALSAGTIPGAGIHPTAVQVMAEVGISLEGQYPKRLTQQLVDSADQIITMGCGVDTSACPARFLITEDWGLEDPAGQPVEKVRQIRDEIRKRVETLLNLVD